MSVAPQAARVAGASEPSTFRQRSCSRGDWKPMIAMPAVMLQKNTSHITMNRPERMACRAVRSTDAVVFAAGRAADFTPAFTDGTASSGGLTMNRAGTSVSTMKMPARE